MVVKSGENAEFAMSKYLVLLGFDATEFMASDGHG